MDQAFFVHALTDARLGQQLRGDLFEYPRPDASEHMLGGLALDDHRLNAGTVQQLSEQQARGARADDGYLGVSHMSVTTCTFWVQPRWVPQVPVILNIGTYLRILRRQPRPHRPEPGAELDFSSLLPLAFPDAPSGHPPAYPDILPLR